MQPMAIACPPKKMMQEWHQMNTAKHGIDDCERVATHTIATNRS